MAIEFQIYPNRANVVKLTLRVKNEQNNWVWEPLNHASISKLGVYMGSTLYLSDTNPALFDLTNQGFFIFKPGAIADIAYGKYNCKIVVYDLVNYVAGEIWHEGFVVNIARETN